MKISKTELRNLIKESFQKQIKERNLKDRLKKIQSEIDYINENEDLDLDNHTSIDEKPKESIFDSKPGETVILNFEGVTIKIERQLDDLFKVVDAAESQKINDGDYVKIQGNDNLEKGTSFKFIIFRKTNLPYETNNLESWKIIKN
jgi:hypothetical protein